MTFPQQLLSPFFLSMKSGSLIKGLGPVLRTFIRGFNYDYSKKFFFI